MTIALVTIGYSDHEYTATINKLDQLEAYLSAEPRQFKIVNVNVIDTSYLHAVSQVINRVHKFSNCTL
jgi:hypothetical protein